jgi:16S rRNA (adenine1518-N6/adenine1519-N6)-dimethyltransferase
LVANIPYNITSLIIRKFLEEENKPETMVLLVQKEVAERIIAEPGDMSLLAVSVQFYAEAEIVATVPKESFFPVPKVDSAIIKLSAISCQLSANEEKSFFRIVKFGFAARRKTLENNLSAGMHIPKDSARAIIKKAGLEAKIRAEGLGVEDWIRLFEITKEGCRGEKRED